jgi:cation transport ATPase
VAVGRAEWTAAEVPRWVRRVRRQASLDDALTVFVAVDGHLAGALLFRESARTPRRRYDACARSACGGWCWLPATEPTSPRAWPQPWHRHGPGARPGHHRIGVALGARGSTASSEAADVVLTVDRLDRLAETIAIARRARRIALQSVLVGMGLSLAHARTVAPSQR